MVAKIAIDAGHGMNTPGKRSPSDEREWSFNNKVVQAATNYLKHYEDVSILRLDDSTGKTDIPLKTRTDKANQWGADILISCHHNANTGKWGSWTGTETYHYPSSSNSKRLAQAIHPRIVKAYGLRDRGIKTANFHMLRESRMPAVLIEGGFMDSTIDIKKLRDDKVLDAAGKAIAEGVAEYFGLKKKMGGQSKPSKPSKSSTKSSKGSSTKWTGQILRKSDSGPIVRSMQNMLISKGFSLPKFGADGHFGDETERAVRAAQRATGIPVDGIAGPQTYRALRNYSGSSFRFRHWNGSVIRNGERGKHVKELQDRLLALGYKLPKYGADGVMGSETENAVRQFQRDSGIGVDGIPGPQTKRALERR